MTSTTKPAVLLLTGGGYHDFAGGAALIEQTLSQRFTVQQSTDAGDLGKLAGGKFAAVVLYTQGQQGKLTASLLASLEQFVQAGGGLVGIHCASDSFTDNPGYLKLLGSQFINHGPVMDFTVRPVNSTNPLVARTEAFRIHDELYILKPHAEFETLAVAHWQGKDQPMAYQRNVGKGKVLYLANGHHPQSLGNRYFQRLLERAVRSASGEAFNKTMKAGILGYGGAFNMGKLHAEAIRAQTGMSVTSVCDADAKRAAQAKTELGQDIATYTDMNAFLTQGDFDIVVEILPHNLHASACITASKAGKHVVSEKPFCITLDEADRMLAAAGEAGKIVTCFHNRRWDGDFTAMLHLIRAGAIGLPYRIDAATAGYGEPGTWWRSSKEISGGMMYDWGAHFCDWILNLANKRIKSVTGDFQKRKWFGSTNEDYTFALIRFEDDTTATLEQGNAAAIARDSWRILGTDGAIGFGRGEKEITLVQFTENRRMESKVAIPNSNWTAYYANVANHLLMDERLVVTPQQARRVIGVIHLAEQSAKQGGVPLALPGEDKFTPDYMLPW